MTATPLDVQSNHSPAEASHWIVGAAQRAKLAGADALRIPAGQPGTTAWRSDRSAPRPLSRRETPSVLPKLSAGDGRHPATIPRRLPKTRVARTSRSSCAHDAIACRLCFRDSLERRHRFRSMAAKPRRTGLPGFASDPVCASQREFERVSLGAEPLHRGKIALFSC